MLIKLINGKEIFISEHECRHSELLARLLSANSVFETIRVDMVKLGHSSDELDDMFNNIREFYNVGESDIIDIEQYCSKIPDGVDPILFKTFTDMVQSRKNDTYYHFKGMKDSVVETIVLFLQMPCLDISESMFSYIQQDVRKHAHKQPVKVLAHANHKQYIELISKLQLEELVELSFGAEFFGIRELTVLCAIFLSYEFHEITVAELNEKFSVPEQHVSAVKSILRKNTEDWVKLI